jgi:hypothetical protein
MPLSMIVIVLTVEGAERIGATAGRKNKALEALRGNERAQFQIKL